MLAVFALRRNERFYFVIEEAVRLRFKRFQANETSACLRANQAALYKEMEDFICAIHALCKI